MEYNKGKKQGSSHKTVWSIKMLGENHSLFIEFPEMKDKIQQLKMVDENFKAMSDRYHELDHEIRGLEGNNIPTDDMHFTKLKLERLQLKDKIISILNK